MKRIQSGIEDVQNEVRIKCSSCEEIFDISAEDIEKEQGMRRYYTTCPNPKCKAKIVFYEGGLPRNILCKVDLRETK